MKPDDLSGRAGLGGKLPLKIDDLVLTGDEDAHLYSLITVGSGDTFVNYHREEGAFSFSQRPTLGLTVIGIRQEGAHLRGVLGTVNMHRRLNKEPGLAAFLVIYERHPLAHRLAA